MADNDDLRKIIVFIYYLKEMSLRCGIKSSKVEESCNKLLAEVKGCLESSNVNSKLAQEDAMEEKDSIDLLLDRLVVSTEVLSKSRVETLIDFNVVYELSINIIKKMQQNRDLSSPSIIKKMMYFVQNLSYINAINISYICNMGSDKIENYILKHIELIQKLNLIYLEILVIEEYVPSHNHIWRS